MYLSGKMYNANKAKLEGLDRMRLRFAMGGSDDRKPGGDHRDRELVAAAIAIGGLLTAAWIVFLVWFVFFYLL